MIQKPPFSDTSQNIEQSNNLTTQTSDNSNKKIIILIAVIAVVSIVIYFVFTNLKRSNKNVAKDDYSPDQEQIQKSGGPLGALVATRVPSFNKTAPPHYPGAKDIFKKGRDLTKKLADRGKPFCYEEAKRKALEKSSDMKIVYLDIAAGHPLFMGGRSCLYDFWSSSLGKAYEFKKVEAQPPLDLNYLNEEGLTNIWRDAAELDIDALSINMEQAIKLAEDKLQLVDKPSYTFIKVELDRDADNPVFWYLTFQQFDSNDPFGQDTAAPREKWKVNAQTGEVIFVESDEGLPIKKDPNLVGRKLSDNLYKDNLPKFYLKAKNEALTHAPDMQLFHVRINANNYSPDQKYTFEYTFSSNSILKYFEYRKTEGTDKYDSSKLGEIYSSFAYFDIESLPINLARAIELGEEKLTKIDRSSYDRLTILLFYRKSTQVKNPRWYLEFGTFDPLDEEYIKVDAVSGEASVWDKYGGEY